MNNNICIADDKRPKSDEQKKHKKKGKYFKVSKVRPTLS